MKVVPSDRPAMVKPTQPTGVPPGDTGKNDKFKEKLLRKRRTYVRYFDRGLAAIDEALRRVAVFRGCHGERVVRETAVGKSGEIYETGSTIRVLSASSESLALCREAVRGSRGAKEKTALKKYALRCTERRSRRQHRRDNRLLSWELRQKKIEKEERDWNWKIKLGCVQSYYDAGGRQPTRSEGALQCIPVLPLGSSLRAVTFIVVGPASRTGDILPYYFDDKGNRVRLGSRRSVLG